MKILDTRKIRVVLDDRDVRVKAIFDALGIDPAHVSLADPITVSYTEVKVREQ